MTEVDREDPDLPASAPVDRSGEGHRALTWTSDGRGAHDTDHWSRGQLAVIAALVATTAVVSSIGLGSKDLWLDEADTWYVISGGVGHMASVIAAWDLNSSPYYAAMWLWGQLGDGETWLRIPSLVAAVATVPVIALLGRRLFDRQVGLVAALLVAVSGSMLVHAQEARAYTLATLLAATASILFLRAERRRSAAAWGQYALGAVLLVTVHLFGILVIAGHAAWLLATQPDRVRRPEPGMLLAGAAIAALSLPFAAVVLGQHGGYGGEYIGPPWSPGTYVPILRFWSGGSELTMLVLLAAGTAVATAIVVSASRRESHRVAPEWFVVLGVAVPTALVALVSLGPNLLLARYLIVCVPCVAIMAARGLQLVPNWLAPVLVLVVVGASLDAGRRWLERDPIHQFEVLTTSLVERLEPDDQIVFLSDYDRLGVLYYSRHVASTELPVLVHPEPLDPPGWRGSIDVADPIDRASDARTWVVAHLDDGEILESHADQLHEWEDAGLVPSTLEIFPDRALLSYGGAGL